MPELKAQQPPINVKKQIANLREKGLTIHDEKYAEAFLENVSYFRLIKAYSLELKVSKNGRYEDGVCFDDIVNLYLFNCSFRQKLFVQIERIEVALRCRVSNYFCEKYGVLGYEDANNFNDLSFHAKFLSEIENEIKRNKKTPFVNNFQTHYEGGKLPLYACIELFTFGTLSKFYKNMTPIDKKSVASLYGVKYSYLESWIESMSYVRNVCAHYGRLYNVKLTKMPHIYKQYSDRGINNSGVFATLLTMKYLLPNDEQWESFVCGIEALKNMYPNVKLESMGFPVDWRDVLSLC
ncbi:MAG: Abi family protein [Clostridiales bacterium]|jgi:abortive infection bacteriophage resistance protein|nr:Abi family protein [Clostridiales bacterium]